MCDVCCILSPMQSLFNLTNTGKAGVCTTKNQNMKNTKTSLKERFFVLLFLLGVILTACLVTFAANY